GGVRVGAGRGRLRRIAHASAGSPRRRFRAGRARPTSSSIRRDLTDNEKGAWVEAPLFKLSVARRAARHAMRTRPDQKRRMTPTTIPWMVMSFSWTYIGAIVSLAG